MTQFSGKDLLAPALGIHTEANDGASIQKSVVRKVESAFGREEGEDTDSRNDAWIAALVIQHDLALFAREAHFDHLPQLVR